MITFAAKSAEYAKLSERLPIKKADTLNNFRH